MLLQRLETKRIKKMINVDYVALTLKTKRAKKMIKDDYLAPTPKYKEEQRDDE